MGTTVTYRGIRLENVITREFTQSPVRDPSNTDIWHQRFTVHVSTVANVAILAGQLQTLGLVGQGASMSDLIKNARLKLGEDRFAFKYEMGGVTLLEATAFNDPKKGATAPDVDNGPKVLSINIRRISPATVHIDFRIQVALVDCTDNPTKILDNRWQCADDVGENFATTRTWRGKVRASRVLNFHDTQEEVRKLVAPPILKGWKRTKMHFTSELNGLELGYEITDVEMVGDAPPEPACRFTGRHVATLQGTGNKSVSEIHVRLDGFKQADKDKLMQRCVQIMEARLQLQNWKAKNNAVFEHVVFVDHFGDNVNAIECTARISEVHEGVNRPAAIKLGHAILGQFGKLNLPNYDRRIATSLGNYPSSLANAFACHLQTPCVNDHKTPKTIESTTESGKEYPEEDTKPEITYEVGRPEDIPSPGVSSDHREAMYSHFRVESHYNTPHNRASFPKAMESSGDSKPTAVNIDFGPITCTRIVKVEAERIGEWPKLWKAVDFVDGNGIRHWIMDEKINLRPPTAGGDDKELYVIDAVYKYDLERRPTPSEKWSTAGIPWDDKTAAENAADGSKFLGDVTGEKGLA